MKKITGILLVFLFFMAACDQPVVEKPKPLIKEKMMIDMLVDIHLAEATFIATGGMNDQKKVGSSADFYYSVLEKYNVPDTVFEKSFVFYASNPKNFEKMYRKVMSNLSETEQELSGRKEEILDFDKLDK